MCSRKRFSENGSVMVNAIVPACFKDDNATTQVNGKVGNSTPAPSETPDPIVT